ncbi:MAG: Fic family protein [Bacteroidota bacterium]|nr:Fic family protein [Bacteroidota bacterium]
MVTPNMRFSEALKVLKSIQDRSIIGIHTSDIPKAIYRKILVKEGFIREVTKGWYIATNPAEKFGETTSWYSSYWDFIAQYLNHKYGDNWCLSADQSVLLHAGNWSVPHQILIRSPLGNNNPTPLPHNTSLFNLKTSLPPSNHIEVQRGIRMYKLQPSLIYCTTSVYSHSSLDARTALSLLRDASEVLPILLENGHTTIAGRLAGAFRNINRDDIANQIIETFKQAYYEIREDDPFHIKLSIDYNFRERSPYATRIRLMWMQMREIVIANFPSSPGLTESKQAFLKSIEDIYVTDAYHSLSIERYKVTPELIERVSSGKWNVKDNDEDKNQRDAMAARGYYQCFQSVRDSISTIIDGANSGKQVSNDHGKWYRELFDPSVASGLLKASDLSGYRNNQVYIGSSKHVPLNVDAMRDAMPVFFELLEQEPEASVRAVLGHFIFVFIHPYMDGNGRIARFIMNTMLASGGYTWTVIPLESRDEYMYTLEKASAEQNILPFVKFISYLVTESLSGNMVAEVPFYKNRYGY